MPSPFWTALIALALLLVGSPRAVAQRADKATAEVLFERGVALMEAGEHARACPLLEQSEAVDHGIGTMLYLAECYEQVGRNASAWAEYRRAASLASAAGQVDRARAASERAARLEAGLSTLTVEVEAATPSLTVERDGAELPPSAWALPVPVDPGEHTVAARSEGCVPWSARIYVGAAGAAVVQPVPRLVPLGPAPGELREAREARETREAPPPALPPPLPPPRGAPLRRNPWFWTAVTVVAASAALALGLVQRPEQARSTRGYGGSTGDRVAGP